MDRRRDYERLLEGAYDLHVHAYPDMSLDNGGFTHSMKEVVEGYRTYKMGGFVLKTHGFPAPALANYLDSEFDDINIIGSVCLNTYAGGTEPYVVEMAAEIGCKVIWLPTVTSINEYRNPGMRQLIGKGEWLPKLMNIREDQYIHLTDENGELLDNVKECISLCKEKDMMLATGHNSAEDCYKVGLFAKDIGMKNIVLTHAKACCSYHTLSQIKEFTDLGYAVEMCTVELDPFFVDLSLADIKEIIETAGPSHCVLSTDWYMGWRRSGAEDLLKVLSELHFYGVRYDDLEEMMKTPGRLLGLA